MKIAIIRQRYNPYGGAERFVSRALSALSQRRGVTLHLIARKWEPIEGIQFHACNPFYLGRLTRDLGFAVFACKTAEKLDVDLIQSHERLCCCDIYRAGDGVHREWLKQRSRQMNSLMGFLLQANPYHLYLKLAERKMLEGGRLRAVICNSDMVKNEMLGYFRIAEHKIHVIPNGIDTQAFHPGLKQERDQLRQQWRIPADAPVYLFVGSGYQRKGLKQTLQAFALQQQGYLLVVGHDKHEQRYRTLAKQLNIGERVLFFGSQQDVKPFYGLSDVFVLPTLYDPFSNAVLEAMASGLPVITSLKSGAAEILTNGVNGFVCDALDIQQLADSMQKLSDRQLAHDMGLLARARAESHDWSIIGDALTHLYQSLGV
ncbi:glycosyltransferase family 4 protein [Methylomonas sp. LL1]|uniref:glycosyltransferase family 4 protein n=1 Tax=Methylomonas sp. LL1 TaxID=2785785 RepID=UPI0018C43948|nr:glycosyltransferase family 4 protein [Methylomonas sp. LL1]QPK62114.1 glycosyltransferase family 4 protein [Methylomonas sp. LL1]